MTASPAAPCISLFAQKCNGRYTLVSLRSELPALCSFAYGINDDRKAPCRCIRHHTAPLGPPGSGFVALSNGAAAATEALLRSAGLDEFVEQVISVEEVKLSKPRREVYLHTAKATGMAPGDLALVATHAWDVHGAKAAGLVAGFVSRGQPYPTTMFPPDFTGQELIDTARILAAAS